LISEIKNDGRIFEPGGFGRVNKLSLNHSSAVSMKNTSKYSNATMTCRHLMEKEETLFGTSLGVGWMLTRACCTECGTNIVVNERVHIRIGGWFYLDNERLRHHFKPFIFNEFEIFPPLGSNDIVKSQTTASLPRNIFVVR
jgi:hypothetical protein